MATRRIFWGFCKNRYGIGSLHYISSRSDLAFVLAEIFVIEKQLPDSPSQGVDDSPTRRVGVLATPRLAESRSRRLFDSMSFSFKHSKADSLTRRVGESSTLRLAESKSQRLPDSPNCSVPESGSRFLITNISANSKPKAERLERYCKLTMGTQYLQKPQKIRLIAMSL
jgi:hypothetical protein